MTHRNVKSSNVQSVGYDESTQTLEVAFRGSGTYAYSDVPKHLHNSLMSSKSVGGFLGNHVKGKFDCKKK